MKLLFFCFSRIGWTFSPGHHQHC